MRKALAGYIAVFKRHLKATTFVNNCVTHPTCFGKALPSSEKHNERELIETLKIHVFLDLTLSRLVTILEGLNLH